MKVEIKIKEVPKSCDTCKFYKLGQYRCHNERGYESECMLGFMAGKDMREVNFRVGHRKGTRHENCNIEEMVKE